MAYKPTRQENEDVIRALAHAYPKCFVEEPKLRRPLKRTIVADLQKDGMPMAYDLFAGGVEWYESHFAYLYNLQPGAKRIDLNGMEVDTVTEQEFLAAQDKIRIGRQKQGATRTLTALHAAGRVTDDQVRKLDAPPMIPKTAKMIAPELTRLYEAVVAANTTLTGTADLNLRSAMTAAALGVVCKEAQRVIDSLEKGDDQ
jgi:ProP effector